MIFLQILKNAEKCVFGRENRRRSSRERASERVMCRGRRREMPELLKFSPAPLPPDNFVFRQDLIKLLHCYFRAQACELTARLSGGEKSRVALAQLTMKRPHVPESGRGLTRSKLLVKRAHSGGHCKRKETTE